MKKQNGYSIIELLVVIAIIAIIGTISYPALKNFNNEQAVVQAVNNIKTDFRLTQNQSISGVNGHWFGLRFTTDSNKQYQSYEIDAESCAFTKEDISSCMIAGTGKTKQYPTGVTLQKITLINTDGDTIDTANSIDIRFNQSPFTDQIALSFRKNSSHLNYPSIARAELVFQNGNIQRSLVIDGGNICNKGAAEETQKCGGLVNQTGGPQAGKVFIVNKK